MNQIDTIITGTGRCGTVYLAKLLTSLDIPCSHEGIFNWEGLKSARGKMKRPVSVSARSTEYTPNFSYWLASHFIQAESSYMAAPYLDSSLLINAKIIHVVRNPIRVIFSLCDEFFYFDMKNFPFFKQEVFIEDTMKEFGVNLKEIDDNILRATLYYIKWNEMIEEKCIGRDFLFHRIEDDVQPILNFIGKSNADNYFKDKRANTKRHKIFNRTIHDIPNSKIKDMLIEKSIKYGYDLFIEFKPPRMMFI